VLTVNWNSLPYLRVMLEATRHLSPPETRLLVVDNGSTDGSISYLAGRDDVEVLRLPTNVGHGIALDLGAARVRTEHLAVLDVDAFPISDRWLGESIGALDAGAQVAGARLHRNFIHPCFLVMRTSLIHRYGLTFRPVGSIARLDTAAPLFLDVGEALSQRAIVKFGGSQALHPFEITSLEGPGLAGAVFGGLVYHNMFATQGSGSAGALALWERAVAEHHPHLQRD
jgi:glycosyltransferase involved in cell wall biosynthesis